ncbi:hypothetical protein M1116_04355 [Patescibacteria group bacterium]|nr:hypothetical protein [Patescibacteria group bacterium]
MRNNYSQDLTPPEYWQLDGIKTGATVYNPFGNKLAELVSIEKTPWRLGTMESVEMVMQYKAVYNNREKVYTVDGKPLRVGDPMTVNFGSQTFTGLIRNIYKDGNDRFAGYAFKSGKLVVKLRDYDPWQIEKLKSFVLSDSNGKEILRVTNVQSVPANVYISDSQSNQKIYLGKSPDKVDATVTMELHNVLCQSGGACLFNYYHQLGIGNGFYADNGQTAFGNNSSIMDFEVD